MSKEPATIDPVRSEVIFTDGSRCDLNAYLDSMPEVEDIAPARSSATAG